MSVEGNMKINIFLSRCFIGALFLAELFCHPVAADVPVAAPDITELLIGSELDYPPYATVTKEGEAGGFSVDLMKAVCAEMNIRCSFVVRPWATLKENLKNGEIDALPLVSYSVEREAVYDFTVPHTISYGVAFKRKGAPDIESVFDLRDKDIVVLEGDAAHDWLLRNDISKNITVKSSLGDVLKVLSEGKHEYAFSPKLVGLYLQHELKLNNIEITGPLFDAYGRGYGFAVQEGNAPLLMLLNEGLATVKKKGTYDKIYQQWFGLYEEQIQFGKYFRIFFLTLGTAASLIIAAMLWISFLRRRIAVEEQLRQNLSFSKEVAEMASRAKSNFLASISHDLRTPLNAIIGFSEVLSDEMFGALNDKQKEYLNHIVLSATHLLRLINDILDISKIESGQIDLDETEVPVEEIVSFCINNFDPSAYEANVSFQNTCAGAAIRVDEIKFRQVLINLIGNAIKFSKGLPHITVRTVVDEAGVFKCSVSDKGIGIPEKALSEVFKPFSQVESVAVRSHEGAGLGLSIVQKLMELHGGTVDIQSTLGEGTTVTLTLPKERVSF